MIDITEDPIVIKLIAHAKEHKTLTWDELNDLLPEKMISSEAVMDEILDLLEQEQIQVIDDAVEDTDDVFADELDEVELESDEQFFDGAELEQGEPEFAKPEETHKKLLNNDREAIVDDPIKLYLRDIGKENLLTAEQEVELSKAMEEGETIIKDAIKNSGVLVSEVQMIAQKAFAKINSSENNKPRKELSYEDAEKKRLRQAYGEQLRPIYPDIKSYIALKKKLYDKETLASFLDDADLQKTRKKVLNYLQKIEFP